LNGQLDSLLNFLMYLGVALPIVIIGILVFIYTTPYREYRLIQDGAATNDPQKIAAAKAASHDLSGKIIGLSIVVASVVINSGSILDLLIWGLIGIIFQVVFFYLFAWLTPFHVIQEIPKGNVAIGIFSSRMSIVSGLLLAALVSY
jgi:putative membrane protein